MRQIRVYDFYLSRFEILTWNLLFLAYGYDVALGVLQSAFKVFPTAVSSVYTKQT